MALKTQNLKTQAELKSYLLKNGVEESFYTFKSTDSLIAFHNTYTLDIPEVYFFNPEGKFIPYKSSSEDCNAKALGFIDDLKNHKSEDSLNFNDLKAYWKQNSEVNDKNYKAIILWASYLGKLNKDKSFNWLNAIQNLINTDSIAIDVYLMSADLIK